MSENDDLLMLCANCGKGEECNDDLKACAACKLVKYCSRDCQIAHRPQHKKKCKKRAAELYDEALFKDHSPREECPICMLPPPLYDNYTGMNFHSCCGKRICIGCEYAMHERGGKNMKRCPFCRTPEAKSDKEHTERLTKTMEKGNGRAFYVRAGCYAQGINGFPQDSAKANELFLKAGELGCADGYCNLGSAYYQGLGVEIDKKKAKNYYEIAAMKGVVQARHNLGCMEGHTGNYKRAHKHFIIAAKAGGGNSLENVKQGYMDGNITKGEYANTLRAYQKSQDEMKSDARDKALASFQGKGIMSR